VLRINVCIGLESGLKSDIVRNPSWARNGLVHRSKNVPSPASRIEALLGAFDHGLGCADFGLADSA
jgi:hypothetical protein